MQRDKEKSHERKCRCKDAIIKSGASLTAGGWEPGNADHDFEDVFYDDFGRTGLEDMDHNPKRYHEPIMNEVLLLEASKRYAAQVANHINAKDVAHRTQDDLNVFFQNETIGF